jgi:putative DNA primase/helicase
VVLIPFSIEFIADPDPNNPKQRKADTTLTAALTEEKEGILAWLVAGCLEWQRVGLSIPALVHSETKEYRAEMEEAVREFFDGYVKRDMHATGFLTIGQIHSKYLQWAKENSVPYPIKSPRGFSPYCSRFLGDPTRRNTGYGYEMTTVTYVGSGRSNYN